MLRFSFFLLVVIMVVAVSARSCFIEEKKDTPEIHVIHLPDHSKDKDIPEFLAVDIPNDRRKRDVRSVDEKRPCSSDKDCAPDERCFGKLQCVKRNKETITVHKQNQINGMLADA